MTWLDNIKKRVDAATPGPWFHSVHDPSGNGNPKYQYHKVVLADTDSIDMSHANAAFIAHARTDVPRVVKALEILLAAVRQDCDQIGEGHSRACKAADAIRRGEF